MRRSNVYRNLSLACLMTTLSISAANEPKPETLDMSQKALEEYTLYEVEKEEGIFQLNDGSIWKACEKDKPKIEQWKEGAAIGFTISEGWITGHHYVFTNMLTYETVLANLYKEPTDYHRSANWLAFVEPKTGTMFLQSGAKFVIYPDDLEIFEDWKADDFIMIGTYDSMFTPYKHLIFNFRTKKYVFAKYLGA